MSPNAFKELPDDALLPVRTVRLLIQAMQSDGGPQTVTTRQAAQIIGWRQRDWSRWADEGLIPGAVRVGGKWALPRDACQQLHDKRMGRTAPTEDKPISRRGNHVTWAEREAARQAKQGNPALPFTPRLLGRRSS